MGSFAAHWCMTQAMKLVDAMVAVPIDFVRLPLIAVIGALFYAEPFDPLVMVGAAVIFAGPTTASRAKGVSGDRADQPLAFEPPTPAGVFFCARRLISPSMPSCFTTWSNSLR